MVVSWIVCARALDRLCMCVGLSVYVRWFECACACALACAYLCCRAVRVRRLLTRAPMASRCDCRRRVVSCSIERAPRPGLAPERRTPLLLLSREGPFLFYCELESAAHRAH